MAQSRTTFFVTLCLFGVFCFSLFYNHISFNYNYLGERFFTTESENKDVLIFYGKDDENSSIVSDILANFWNLNHDDTRPGYSQNGSSKIKNWISPGSTLFYFNLTKNCTLFKNFWQYPTLPSSKEEAEYPLAFVFMGYKNLPQTLRLFRAIYEPQNVYCFNWDSNSDTEYQNALQNIGSCFSNVLIPNTRRDIGWCGYSLLEATMDCMKLLRYTKRTWKYAQIISWNDYPIKTNREMVQIMKLLNGTMDVSLYKPQHHTFYAEFFTKKLNPVLPGNLVLYKSSYAVTMPREFVSFMFDSQIAQELYSWLNNSICTEEMYFSTLAHNRFLQAPGGFPGTCLQFYDDNGNRKQFISRYQIWSYDENERKLCKGKFVSKSLKSCLF